jgi:hypothetical protein
MLRTRTKETRRAGWFLGFEAGRWPCPDAPPSPARGWRPIDRDILASATLQRTRRYHRFGHNLGLEDLGATAIRRKDRTCHDAIS